MQGVAAGYGAFAPVAPGPTLGWLLLPDSAHPVESSMLDCSCSRPTTLWFPPPAEPHTMP